MIYGSFKIISVFHASCMRRSLMSVFIGMPDASKLLFLHPLILFASLPAATFSAEQARRGLTYHSNSFMEKITVITPWNKDLSRL
jgi:hypothetical protein